MKQIQCLEDFRYPYEFDEVTCFEHPIIVVLDYIKEGYGKLFTMLAKLNGIYLGTGEECLTKNSFFRERTIRKMEDYFAIKCINNSGMSKRKIRQSIIKDEPIIVGINLKDIFYSTYYYEKNWCHWVIIKGMDEEKDICTLLDNVQFREIGHTYADFPIPYNYLKKAVKGYIKRYGKEFSFFVLKKQQDIKQTEILQKILYQYLQYDKKCENNYRQKVILKEYWKLCQYLGGESKELFNETRNQLININKYRFLFFNEICGYMKKLHYEIEEEGSYQNYIILTSRINETWQKQVLYTLVRIMKNEPVANIIGQEIVELEDAVHKEIEKFYYFLLNDNVTMSLSQNAETVIKQQWFVAENNRDIIKEMSGDVGQGEVSFLFDDDNVYNWWDMDESPKIVFKSIKQISMLCMSIEYCKGDYDKGNIEIGLFIRDETDGSSSMIGIENNKYLVYSEIGVLSQKLLISNEKIIRLYLEFNKSEIEMGVITKAEKEVIMIKKDFNWNNISVGIACKTWGEPTRREVKCEWKSINNNEGDIRSLVEL